MEIYVSTDIEADGPIPGPYSMLSFASAVYMSDKILVDTYYANLETLPGAAAHPKTSARRRSFQGASLMWEVPLYLSQPHNLLGRVGLSIPAICLAHQVILFQSTL